jgi:hypothetical protein
LGVANSEEKVGDNVTSYFLFSSEELEVMLLTIQSTWL